MGCGISSDAFDEGVREPSRQRVYCRKSRFIPADVTGEHSEPLPEFFRSGPGVSERNRDLTPIDLSTCRASLAGSLT
jgi:hypothetical protein